MKTIDSIDELEELYKQPHPRSINKVAGEITPLYKRWIEASRFLVIATAATEGCDTSPRGDIDNLVKLPDPKTIWLPDWRGNNRLDTLRNIVRDGRISLMFMVSGSNTVVRVIGSATLTTEPDIKNSFERKGKVPVSVIAVSVAEVYFQCAKALMRSDLWNPETAVSNLPTAGDFLKEQESTFDSATYDSGYAEYAKDKFW